MIMSCKDWFMNLMKLIDYSSINVFLSLINYKIQMYTSFKIETSSYVVIMIKPQSVL